MANLEADYVRSRFAARVRDYANSNISWGSNNYPTGSAPGWFGGTTAGMSGLPSISDIAPTGDLDASQIRQTMNAWLRNYARIRRTRITTRRTRSGYSNNSPRVIYNGVAIAHLSASREADIPTQNPQSTAWTANTSFSANTSFTTSWAISGDKYSYSTSRTTSRSTVKSRTTAFGEAVTKQTAWIRSTSFNATTSWTVGDDKYAISTSRTTRKSRNTIATRSTLKYGTNAPVRQDNLLLATEAAAQITINEFLNRLRNAYAVYAREGTTITLSRNVCHTSCHNSCHNSRGRR